MVKHLASLASDRLILSFAPSTPALLVLKRIGEFFPKGSKVRSDTLMKWQARQALKFILPPPRTLLCPCLVVLKRIENGCFPWVLEDPL